MNEPPGWVQHLFRRMSAGSALHTAFLLDLTTADIAREADARPDGREQLRQAALNELTSDDAGTVANALVFLGAVGSVDDIEFTEVLLNHSSDLVRRAAKSCRFALRRARP